VTLRHLKDAVAQFDRFASDFMAKLAKANIRNPMEIRIINDQLMQLERVFLMVRLIPNEEAGPPGLVVNAKYSRSEQ
jgi:hypothetical protein